MGERRLAIGRFLAAWAALVALQGLIFVGPFAGLPTAAKAAWVLLLQAVKIAPTAWRLNDTGRDPSDAPFLALVPLVNVASFFSRMLEGTPKETLRAKRRAQWEGRLGAFQALGQGARLVRDTLPLGLPLVVIYAAISAGGGSWMLGRLEWAEAADRETLELTYQVLLGVAGFLGLYTLLQFTKRRTASRASWAPSLLLAPTILMAIAMMLVLQGQAQELGPLVFSLMVMAWTLFWASIGGAGLAVGLVLLGDHAQRGESMAAGELLTQIRTRTLDVAGPHGARVHAVTIGMQVVIPGIFYALQLAFTDMIAVLEPDQPALARSGKLTWGMRARLFKVFLVWVVVASGIGAGIVYLLETPEVFMASLIDPRAVGLHTYLLQELVWALTGWVLTMALLRMYQDRLARIEDDRRARQAQAPASEGIAASPTP